MMKIYCSRQTWNERTNEQTDEDQHFLGSYRSQKAQDDAFKESEAGEYRPSIPCSETQEKQNS